LPFGCNSGARSCGRAKIGRRDPVCGEAGGARGYPVEQQMDIGHGESHLGATIGFRFIQSVPPGAATPRRGRHAAGHWRLRHNALPGATPSRRTAVFRTPQSIEESNRRQWLLPVYREASRERGRRIAAGFAGGTPRLDEIIALGMLGMVALLAHKHAPRREAEARRQSGVRGNRGQRRTIERWSS
jgi:hypothetical protein